MINFTKEELEFLKKIGVDPKKLKTRWEWVNKKKAVLFFRDVICPHFNRAPKKDDIDNIGYRGFRTAVSRIGMTINDIKKKLGITPYHEHKYVGMNFQDLVNFFINNIYPDLKEKLSLEEGKPPTRLQVETNGYRGFTYNLDKLKKVYGEILKEAGFEPLKEYKYKGKSYQDLINMFTNKIYPNLIKRKIVKVGTVPTEKDMRYNGYSGFIQKLRRSGRTWTGLLRAAGFKPKYVRLYDGKTYEELLDLFKNTIYPQLKQKYSLHKKEAPLYQHIEKHYRGLIAALKKEGKKFSDLIYDSDLISNDIIGKRVGVKIHHVLELIFMEYNKKYSCHSYFEVSSILDSSKRSDNSIIRNLNFKKTIESKQNLITIPENIKLVNIDYTLSSDRYNIKIKVKKRYQGKEKFLIIVYLGTSRKQIQIPNEVPYRKHVIVLNHNEFAQFMGYSGKYLSEYNRIIKLAQDACFIPQAYEDLRHLAKKAKKELKKYKNRQKEFELYIKNKGLMHLLNEDISDINLDKWITEEKEEVRENESSKEESQASESFEDKKHDTIITENKQEHPFVRKFNKVEEEEDFNDPYLWISPKVRENVEENKEKLLEKVRERNVRYTDSLSEKESLNYFEKDDLETEPKNSFIKESCKESLVENQPLISPEIGIEPAHYMQHQKEPLPDMVQNYIPEQPIEKPIDDPPEKPIDEPPEKPPEKPIDEPPEKPIEKPIDEPPEKPPEKPIDEPPEKPIEKPIDEPPEKPPEKPIDEPPEKPPEKPIDEPPEKPPEKPIDEPPEKPPEKPIDEPPEKPPEKPIDEPPEKPPEKPIDEPPEIPPEMPPISIIGVGVPSEVGVSIISTIEVPQFADFSSSLESPTEEQNFDDDIEHVGNKESYEEENLDDDIENLNNIDDDNDFNENFDGTDLNDIQSNENDDFYNSPDDPINYIDIGEYVPEAEADSSYGYSDCPDDCPSE